MSFLKLFKEKRTVTGGGFIEVLRIALPLILSSSCHAANMFIDRLMLARYSQEAVAAAFTGGLTNFTLSCIFVGTVGYTGTFVAQYYGAKHPERIGSAMWQGIWFAIIGGLLFATGYWWAGPLFRLFHHAPGVTLQEIGYFRILALGIFIFLLESVLPCFWTGRGKTHFVLFISVLVTLLNIPLNYIFIYGKAGLPELGVEGAAWGTILSEFICLIVYICAFLSPSARKRYGTTNFRIDPELMKRMLRYGLPNGINLALDLVSFNTFSILLGCYGVELQEAASITFGIHNIAFCPVIGVATTASILVGQAIGAENAKLAKKSVRSCMQLAMIYSVLMVLLFSLFQKVVLQPFVRPGDSGQILAMEYSHYMLYFISAYLLFDSVNMILSNALRGAGDTNFTMYTMSAVGILLFAVPCLILFFTGCPWWTLWLVMVSEILLLAGIFTFRYFQGKWTKMRVIEVSAVQE